MMKSPVYMDYHATTPVDTRVLDAMMPFYTEHFGNAASLQHRFGWIAKEAVENGRRKIAEAIHAEPHEIIFTSGATESNNLAIKGVAESLREKGNHIITTQIEHKCVLDSCKRLEQKGFDVTYLPVDTFGKVNVENVSKAITNKTILVSIMAANNEIGTIQPIEEIGTLCAERGIIFHTDATQAVGKFSNDVKRMNIHLLSFASHKMYGPKGVGALYVRSHHPRVAIQTQMDGAGHEHGVRSGTLNVPGIVGFGKAVQIAIGEMEGENLRILNLRNRLKDKLLKIEQTSLNGHPTERLPHNLNITFHGVRGDQLMTEIKDVAVSAGSACVSEEIGDTDYSHVLRAIGLTPEDGRSTIRFGLGRFTTEEEVDFAAERFSHAVRALRTYSLEGV
ncbi:MAG: IscS subfamily cysteine desulfurase [Ignavibacteriales bacterium]|nr:IscS subfamily cysteine desulfurase [Ignavibacteriales bacterium]